MKPKINCALASTSYTKLRKSDNVQYRNLFYCFYTLKVLERIGLCLQEIIKSYLYAFNIILV